MLIQAICFLSWHKISEFGKHRMSASSGLHCGSGGTQSLRCRFKEDRNLMALAGKGTAHSAGYREAPPEED